MAAIGFTVAFFLFYMESMPVHIPVIIWIVAAIYNYSNGAGGENGRYHINVGKKTRIFNIAVFSVVGAGLLLNQFHYELLPIPAFLFIIACFFITATIAILCVRCKATGGIMVTKAFTLVFFLLLVAALTGSEPVFPFWTTVATFAVGVVALLTTIN